MYMRETSCVVDTLLICRIFTIENEGKHFSRRPTRLDTNTLIQSRLFKHPQTFTLLNIHITSPLLLLCISIIFTISECSQPEQSFRHSLGSLWIQGVIAVCKVFIKLSWHECNAENVPAHRSRGLITQTLHFLWLIFRLGLDITFVHMVLHHLPQTTEWKVENYISNKRCGVLSVFSNLCPIFQERCLSYLFSQFSLSSPMTLVCWKFSIWKKLFFVIPPLFTGLMKAESFNFKRTMESIH